MSVHQYTSGGRTRNVVNIADPGGTSAAYSLEAANTAPSVATHGFKNFHSQKTLHVLIHNNGLEYDNGGTQAELKVDSNKITIWGYNSSLGGLWSPLRIPMYNNTSATLQFPTAVVPDEIAHDAKYRMTVCVEGVERIAVVLGSNPFHDSGNADQTSNAGSLDIYLGVNTI